MPKEKKITQSVALQNETAQDAQTEEDDAIVIVKYEVIIDAFGTHKRGEFITPDQADKIGLSLTDATLRGFLRPLDADGRIVVEEVSAPATELQQELAKASKGQAKQFNEFKEQVKQLLQKVVEDYEEEFELFELRLKVLEDAKTAVVPPATVANGATVDAAVVTNS